jgi:hypothetical protein
MADVARLTRSSDYAPFVRSGVPSEVRNAAMKKLFSDPHFNVMDGLDTYIDDYGKPDPLPPGMLRQLNQATALGLFDDEDADKVSDAVVAPTSSSPNGHPDESHGGHGGSDVARDSEATEAAGAAEADDFNQADGVPRAAGVAASAPPATPQALASLPPDELPPALSATPIDLPAPPVGDRKTKCC